MDGGDLASARRAVGLTQLRLAEAVGTSRETISAYEHGRKSPTLETLTRLLDALGMDLRVEARRRFVEVRPRRGRPAAVPTTVPRLPAHRALATVSLPLHLDWSPTPRWFDLTDRRQRARLYEIVLREGTPTDIESYIDGVLLADLWAELVLPREIREAWTTSLHRDDLAA